MAKKAEVYTYFRIDYINCSSVEYDYTIVESIEDISDNIRVAEIDLDDPNSDSQVKITGVGMTRKQYDNFLKKAYENI